MKRPSGFLPENTPHAPEEHVAASPGGNSDARSEPARPWWHLKNPRSLGAGEAQSSVTPDITDHRATLPLDDAVVGIEPVDPSKDPEWGPGAPLRAAGQAAEPSARIVAVSKSPSKFLKRLSLGRSGATGMSPVRSSDDPVAAAKYALKRAERDRKNRERRDQRRFTAPSRLRKRQWLVSIGAVLALAATVVLGVFTPIMAVREIEVLGAQQVNVSDVQEALGRFEGIPLALVGEQELHRALEPFPLIQRYSIERIPPHTLLVHIEERRPVIAIAGDAGYRMLDAAGVLTGEASEVPSGIVRASGGVVDAASPAFAAAAKVVRDLPDDIRVQVAEISASGEQDISFILHSGVTAVWGDVVDTQRKAVVLRAMLAAVGGATYIDVSAPEAPVFQ